MDAGLISEIGEDIARRRLVEKERVEVVRWLKRNSADEVSLGLDIAALHAAAARRELVMRLSFMIDERDIVRVIFTVFSLKIGGLVDV